jgi:hypothetical protein
MRRQLKYTLRLSEHLKAVIQKFFELQNPYLSQAADIDEAPTYRNYVRDIVTDHPHYDELTPDQKYLHDLGGLISPVLSSYRISLRIPRLQPRTRRFAASANLEESGQRLAMDAYHFKMRVELFGDSSAALIPDNDSRREFQKIIGRIIPNFTRANSRILKYRNFIVHGPRSRIDEFAYLRGLELGGMFLHDDLWFTYNTEFEMARDEWATIAKNVVGTMESANAEIQLLNENTIQTGSFLFLKASS